MKKKLSYETFMEVVWDDATSNDGWVEVKAGDISPERIITRGWLVKKTETYLTLAASIYPDDKDTVGSTQTIPSGMIVSQRELKVTSASSKLRHKVHPKPGPEEIHREPSEG